MEIIEKKIIGYKVICSAEDGSAHSNLKKFIDDRIPKYIPVLDDNFFEKLKNNDFYGRYWELLSCCVLHECCGAELKKPKHAKNKSNYDLDVTVNDCSFALENVCIKNADKGSDVIPEDIICDIYAGDEPKSFSPDPNKLQLRVANAISTKKGRYEALLRDGSIDPSRIYVLTIGFHGLPFSTIQINSFFSVPTSYLGALFPIQYPIVFFEEQQKNNKVYEQKDEITHLSNATYQSHNIKQSSKALVNKGIFLDPKFSFISAVVMSGNSDQRILTFGHEYEAVYNDFILIHNPLAINPLPQRIMPVKTEHVVNIKDGYVEINKIS